MENAFDYIIQMLLNGFQLYVVYRFMNIFFENQYMHKKYAVIAYCIMYVTNVIPVVYNLYPVLSSVVFISDIFLITLCYSSGMKKKVVVSCIIYMCSFIAEAIVAMIIGISGFDMLGNVEKADAFMGIIINMLFWGSTLIIRKFKNVKADASVPGVFIAAIVVISLSSIFLIIMIFKMPAPDKNMITVSFVCILASIFVIVYLYDAFSRIIQDKMQAVAVLKEKDYFHEQSELLKRKHKELSIFRHDIKNHIAVIQQMLDKGQYEKAIEYTDIIADKLNSKDIYSSTGNIAIDSVINYKFRIAEENNVSVHLDIAIPEKLDIADDDIVVVLGNILDNAIEAVLKVADNRYINMNISYSRGCLFINATNNYDSYVSLAGGRLATRKKDKSLHGIGIKSVCSIVGKYDGQFDYEYNDNVFMVNILMYV